MALKDMALTAEEAKAEYGDCAPCSTGGDSDDNAPKYPWGLSLCMDETVLAKLGIGLMPVGTEFVLTAKVTVTGTSSRDRLKGKPSQDMDLQITSLDLSSIQADRMAASASKLYPDKS